RQDFAFRKSRIYEFSTLCILHLDTRTEFLPDSVQHRNHIQLGRTITRIQTLNFSGAGTRHENGSYIFSQRQQVALILEQYDPLMRCTLTHLQMFGTSNDSIRFRWIRNIRLIEKPDPELHTQNIAHAVINNSHWEFAGTHQLPDGIDIDVRRRESSADIQ